MAVADPAPNKTTGQRQGKPGRMGRRMRCAERLAWLTAMLAVGMRLLAGAPALPDQQPVLLEFAELVTLSEVAEPEGALGQKLSTLLQTPFVNNAAGRRGATPKRPRMNSLGEVLRVAVWNIERGSNFQLVNLAGSDPERFLEAVARENRMDASRAHRIRHEAELLAGADLFILNEVDLGMTRTDYRDVARELAEAWAMNSVFGVEFVEVDKLELGLEQLHPPDKAVDVRFLEDQKVDASRYKGIHGSAILSRYPIQSARLFRFTRCYDWFGKEKEEIAKLEKGKRLAADRLFLERISREVRHGERMAILAEIAVPESPTGLVTVVNAHLENKCQPACRQKQMRELLEELREVRNPIILGGDLNTTGSDGAPMSIQRELKKRLRNPSFWASQAVRWFTPLSLPRLFTMPANYFKNYQDPTAASVPLVAPNPEAGLFTLARNHRFADGGRFDFQGDRERSINGSKSLLSNSNERARKGFTTTFTFKRDFKGAIGRMRLDWIFVKPPPRQPAESAEADSSRQGVERLAPYFGRTLGVLNDAVPDRISDHHPVIVDLPLSHRETPPPSAALRP